MFYLQAVIEGEIDMILPGKVLSELLASWEFFQESWTEKACVRKNGLRDGQASLCVLALHCSVQMF